MFLQLNIISKTLYKLIICKVRPSIHIKWGSYMTVKSYISDWSFSSQNTQLVVSVYWHIPTSVWYLSTFMRPLMMFKWPWPTYEQSLLTISITYMCQICIHLLMSQTVAYIQWAGMYSRLDRFSIPFDRHFCGNWVTTKHDLSPILRLK